MDPMTGAALIGGASALGGGLMAGKAQEKANDASYRMMKIQMKKRLQWLALDAKRANIHPLAALGVSSGGFSSPQAVTGPADGLAAMGQSVSRAMAMKGSPQDKEFNAKMQDETLKNAQYKNELLKMQISNVGKNTGTLAPYSGGTIDGQGNGPIQVNPAQRTASPIGKPEQEYGHVPDVGFARTKTGLAPVPSKDVKEKIEDQFIPEMAWAKRNMIDPNLGKGTKPPLKYLPKGYKDWEWSIRGQEWRPVKHKARTPWQKWSRAVTKWQD